MTRALFESLQDARGLFVTEIGILCFTKWFLDRLHFTKCLGRANCYLNSVASSRAVQNQRYGDCWRQNRCECSISPPPSKFPSFPPTTLAIVSNFFKKIIFNKKHFEVTPFQMAIKSIEVPAREKDRGLSAFPLDLAAWEQLWICMIKQQELGGGKCEFAEGCIFPD